MSNSLVERSFKHMAWANKQMLEILKSLPDEAINFSAWNPDWTVGTIAHHIVIAEGRLISRVIEQPAPAEFDPPKTASEIEKLIAICAERDAQLLSLIDTPDQMRKFVRYGTEVEFLHPPSLFRRYIMHPNTVPKFQIFWLQTIWMYSTSMRLIYGHLKSLNAVCNKKRPHDFS